MTRDCKFCHQILGGLMSILYIQQEPCSLSQHQQCTRYTDTLWGGEGKSLSTVRKGSGIWFHWDSKKGDSVTSFHSFHLEFRTKWLEIVFDWISTIITYLYSKTMDCWSIISSLVLKLHLTLKNFLKEILASITQPGSSREHDLQISALRSSTTKCSSTLLR